MGLARRGWAWEFLRRNPTFRAQYVNRDVAAEGADKWGLLKLEDPDRDARCAQVFWHEADCPSVLPLISSECENEPAFDIRKIACKVHIVEISQGKSAVLFLQDGRTLQVMVSGSSTLENATLLTPATVTPGLIATRTASFRRFNDLVHYGYLRQTLYPPEPRAPRLAKVLAALDGSLAELPHREIASLMFSKGRVDQNWGGGLDHMRDQVRRAVSYGHALMAGGYRQFLTPTFKGRRDPDLKRDL